MRSLGKDVLRLILLVFLIIPFITNAQINIGDDVSKINYERPVDYIIGGIEVEGIKYLDKNVIVMLSQIEVGERVQVPGEKISKAIRKLWDQGLFDNIIITATKFEAGKVYLKIYLQERPRLSKFSFDGIRKSEADDIREKINLSRGEVVRYHFLIRTTNIIKVFYA